MADEMPQDDEQEQIEPEIHAGMFKPEELTEAEEKDYLKSLKKRNKYLLTGVDIEERQRIADHIIGLYNDAKNSHEDLCEKLTQWDEVSRLIRKEVIGSDGELPNYRIPLSLLSHEVIHSNVMNTFFSPQDIMRVLPTTAEDTPKVNNISVFGNWSLKNEMDIFPNVDQLFHSSTKNGESVCMIYWKSEYGIDIVREPMRDHSGEIIYDEETKEPIWKEKEVPMQLYNAPFMEVFDRKDYIIPANSLMNQKPEWEGRFIRISYDTYLRDELQGKYYDGSIDMIKSWSSPSKLENEKQDLDGEDLMTPAWNKEFLYFFGGLKINVINEELNGEAAEKKHELEDEMEAIVHIESRTLCSLNKNRRPLKLRPFVTDYFQPDDTGRRAGIGVYELMDSLQKCYDSLYNEYVYGVALSNNPIIFFSPTGNMRDEKFKIQKGFAYPTSDPNSVKLFSFPPPNDSMRQMMELVQQWAQFLFGISDYAAGMQSGVDPEASGKKVQLIVDQGNVRLNMIIKRKNDTLKEIFKRWFLLYKANMPENKFMRVAGEGEKDDPWKFNPISYEDFALQSIPDFELVGNVLNANKQLEANKAIATYQLLLPNFLFSTATTPGLQAYTSLTKWLIDKIGDAQLARFLPSSDTNGVMYTPEEEDALMLQGEQCKPSMNEDFQHHIQEHLTYMNLATTLDIVKPIVAKHIADTVQMAKQAMAAKLAMQQAGIQQQPGGSQPAPQQQPPQGQGMRKPMVGNQPKVSQGMQMNNRPMANAGMPGNGIPQ